MFELQILFGNIVAPMAVILFGWFACSALSLDLRTRIVPFVLAASSGLAICVALAVRNGFSWWPEDAWQKVPVAALIVTVIAAIVELWRSKTNTCSTEELNHPASPQSDSSYSAIVKWMAIVLAVACAAWLIYPRGEAWAELQSQQNQWCLVITLAASLAWWGMAGCQRRVASTVGLATIPLLIASAYLTSLSIMKVTEPLIAIATVLGLCSLIDFRLSRLSRLSSRSLPIMIAPSLFAMSGFIAHASFQSYLGLPRTLYFLAMLSPAMIALVARLTQRKSTRFAIGATVGLALLLAVTIGTWAYIAGEVGSADEW